MKFISFVEDVKGKD